MPALVARRVLVAHDFSPAADGAALAAAADLLRTRQGGTLVLGYIFELMPLPEASIEPPHGLDVLGLGGAMAVDATRRLERSAEELRRAIDRMRRNDQEAPVIEVEVVVRQDTAAEGILALAREQHAGRIVMGTHGRRGIARFFLGSVAERVARAAWVPVLVVKARTEEQDFHARVEQA